MIKNMGQLEGSDYYNVIKYSKLFYTPDLDIRLILKGSLLNLFFFFLFDISVVFSIHQLDG